MKQRCAKAILVTAFEPFGGEKLNPTAKLLEILPETVCGCSVRKLLLPVEFRKSQELAVAGYDDLRPDAVIMLGQAGGRSAVTPETTARNEMSARIPDNAGFQPEGLPVLENGPSVLYSTLPAESIVQAVCAAGVPCEPSGDAGTYVCNALFYRMLSHADGMVPAGFIHVPYIREQDHPDKPFLEFEAIRTGITAALEAVSRIL